MPYDDQTKVLTDDGWKRFSGLRHQDKVASLVSGELRFVKPTAYFSRVWKGKLINFICQNLDLCVTPNHRMYIKRRDHKWRGRWVRKNWRFVRASEVKMLYRVKRGNAKWRGRDVKSFTVPLVRDKYNRKKYNKRVIIDMEDWLRFLGLWIAEGCAWEWKRRPGYYKVCVSQTKNRREVEEILDQLPLHYFCCQGKDYVIKNKSLCYFLKDISGSENKRIPKEFKDLSLPLLKALLEGYLLGDGWLGKNGLKRAATISKQLADDLQEVGIKAGYAVTVAEKKDPRPNRKDLYQISFIERTRTVGIRCKEELDYDGKVYSVEVPSHVILIRRNWKAAWSGASLGIQLPL